MFIEHIKSNVQSVMSHTSPETQKDEPAGIHYGG